MKEIYRTFYLFTEIITYMRCWENMRNVACKSVPPGQRFRNFPRVLLTSLVGYYVGKPIESAFRCLIVLYSLRFLLIVIVLRRHGHIRGGKGKSCHEVTIANFRFHESRNKKFNSVKFTKVTEKI